MRKDRLATMAAPVTICVVVAVVFSVSVSGYLSSGDFFSILNGFALLGPVAAGVAITLLLGELDLSVGAVAVLASVLAVKLSSLGLIPALVIPIAICAVIGALQGALISILKMNSVLISLPWMIGVGGLAYVFASGHTVTMGLAELDLSDQLQGEIWVFSPESLIAIGAIAVAWLVVSFTSLGRATYALGGARREAESSGLPLWRSLVFAFAASATLSAVAGSITGGAAGSASPGSFGELLITALTAALVGGVSLAGGRGSLIGVALGALALQMLSSGIALAAMPSYVFDFATGGLLIGAVLVDFGFQQAAAGSLRGAAPWLFIRTTDGLRQHPPEGGHS